MMTEPMKTGRHSSLEQRILSKEICWCHVRKNKKKIWCQVRTLEIPKKEAIVSGWRRQIRYGKELMFWDGRWSSGGETSTKQREGTGNSRVYPNKLIACKPGSTEVGNTIKSLECQAEEHVRYKESFRVVLCGGCIEDTKARHKKAAVKPKPMNKFGWEGEADDRMPWNVCTFQKTRYEQEGEQTSNKRQDREEATWNPWYHQELLIHPYSV